MAKIEVPDALDEEEAKKTLERKAKRKGGSSSGTSSGSNDGGWLLYLLALIALGIGGFALEVGLLTPP